MISSNKNIAILRKAKMLSFLWVLMGTTLLVGVVWAQVVSMEILPTFSQHYASSPHRNAPHSYLHDARGSWSFNLDFFKDKGFCKRMIVVVTCCIVGCGCTAGQVLDGKSSGVECIFWDRVITKFE